MTADDRHRASGGLDISLVLESAAVDGATLGSHQHELADSNTRNDLERTTRDVAHLENLAIGHAWLNVGRRHMDHQAEASKAAATFEKSTQVVWKGNVLGRDAVDRDARLEAIGLAQFTHNRVITIVRRVLDTNRIVISDDLPDLPAERQVDRGHTNLRWIQGIDLNAALIEFAENHITGQHAHRDAHDNVAG